MVSFLNNELQLFDMNSDNFRMPRIRSITKKVSVYDLRRHGLPVRKIATKLKLSNLTVQQIIKNGENNITKTSVKFWPKISTKQ